jgi:hypothetical protein
MEALLNHDKNAGFGLTSLLQVAKISRFRPTVLGTPKSRLSRGRETIFTSV